MATATLLLHTLLCLGATALILALRRDVVSLQAFGPQGANEDLDAFRRTFRGLGWKLPLLVAALIGAVTLAAQWAPVWRTTLPGQTVLTLLCIFAGLNVLVAAAKANCQQWSANGSFLGLLRASFVAAVAMGLFGLTLFWRFGA